MIRNNKRNGFALIEILVALAIVSIVLVSIYTAVFRSIFTIIGNKNFTKAMIIAESKLNEFILNNKRDLDANNESMEDYPSFTLTRETTRFEHPMLEAMPIPLYSTEITINWKDGQRERKYSLVYIFPKK